MDFSASKENSSKTATSGEAVLYIKVNGLNDKRIASVTRMALLNPGKTKIVLYDITTKKYSLLKDSLISPNEKVLERLGASFGNDSIVLK